MGKGEVHPPPPAPPDFYRNFWPPGAAETRAGSFSPDFCLQISDLRTDFLGFSRRENVPNFPAYTSTFFWFHKKTGSFPF
jgi:hypothetical protein